MKSSEAKLSERRLSQMKGLGPKSEQWLNEVGIHTFEELAALGAVRAYILLQEKCSVKPSMNFLYALVGALQNRHWNEVAKTDKSQLLSELESHREMQQLFSDNKRQ